MAELVERHLVVIEGGGETLLLGKVDRVGGRPVVRAVALVVEDSRSAVGKGSLCGVFGAPVLAPLRGLRHGRNPFDLAGVEDACVEHARAIELDGHLLGAVRTVSRFFLGELPILDARALCALRDLVAGGVGLIERHPTGVIGPELVLASHQPEAIAAAIGLARRGVHRKLPRCLAGTPRLLPRRFAVLDQVDDLGGEFRAVVGAARAFFSHGPPPRR